MANRLAFTRLIQGIQNIFRRRNGMSEPTPHRVPSYYRMLDEAMQERREAGKWEIDYSEIFPGCEYTDEEREFIVAMDAYINMTGHKFPAFTEILKVAKSLGYRKT